MILGSNRPDIRFQGDPSDGYQVHISVYNSPVSGSGWDSGFVSLNPGLNSISAMSGVLNPQTSTSLCPSAQPQRLGALDGQRPLGLYRRTVDQ